MTQLHFPLPASTSYLPEDYVVTECNRLAYHWMIQWPHWPAHAMWLCGPAASGKSHLLHIWAARSDAKILSPQQLTDFPQELVGEHTAIAIDGDWNGLQESALFHLLNYAKESGKWVLIAHRQAPSDVKFQLPDLLSRVRALPVATLEQPDDMLLRAVMMKQLADRQLSVEADVITYILNHIERSCEAIRAAIEQLDCTAMQQKRRITLPFAREVLTGS